MIIKLSLTLQWDSVLNCVNLKFCLNNVGGGCVCLIQVCYKFFFFDDEDFLLFNYLCISFSNLFYVFRHAHPGNPYVFGLVEDDHDLDFPEPMPVVGMIKIRLC